MSTFYAITQLHNSSDLNGQTFFTSKIVEYGIVQDTPPFLPLHAEEAMIFKMNSNENIYSTHISMISHQYDKPVIFLSYRVFFSPDSPASEYYSNLVLPLWEYLQNLNWENQVGKTQ